MISIRKATDADFPSVLALIKELAKFENAPLEVTNSVAQMLDEKDNFYCLVAESKAKEIVGMALYYHVYYTWVGKSMYLDDLYVKQSFRGQQIGSQLLNEVILHAKKTNCKRIRWQVLDWNEPAIKFYQKIGANLDGEWINCDLKQDGIDQFLNGLVDKN